MGAITRALGLSDKGGTDQAAPIMQARAEAVVDSAKIKADDLRTKAEASAALATAANERAALAKRARRANSLVTGGGETGLQNGPSTTGRTTLGV